MLSSSLCFIVAALSVAQHVSAARSSSLRGVAVATSAQGDAPLPVFVPATFGVQGDLTITQIGSLGGVSTTYEGIYRGTAPAFTQVVGPTELIAHQNMGGGATLIVSCQLGAQANCQEIDVVDGISTQEVEPILAFTTLYVPATISIPMSSAPSTTTLVSVTSATPTQITFTSSSSPSSSSASASTSETTPATAFPSQTLSANVFASSGARTTFSFTVVACSLGLWVVGLLASW